MRMFAVAAPGVEGVLEREVAALRGAAEVRRVEGGVELAGDEEVLRRTNLWLRTATRVLVRVGEVRARDFAALRRDVAVLPWERFAAGVARVEVDATARKCRLYHTGGIAERVEAAVRERAGTGDGELHVLVRGVDDVFTISVDSSGELLHRRGYREETAKAPLRETLAAAILALAGWDPGTPLVDPMCGAGTFVLEAALLALGRPPGARRGFAFERWPGHRADLLRALRDAAAAAERPAPPAPILGSDRDPGAVEAARRNAERGGLARHVTFACADAAAAALPDAPGLIVANPPYGRRIPPAVQRDAHAALAALARRARAWRLAVLTSDPALPRALGRRPDAQHALVNGGVRVRLFVFGAAR